MSFRPATLDDAYILYRWRKHDEQQPAYEGHKTTARDHIVWLQQRIDNPLVRILIWEHNGEPAGMVRIDSGGEIAFHAQNTTTAVKMLRAAHRFADQYGGRLKVVLDQDDERNEILVRAGYLEYPARFHCFKPGFP